MENDGCLVVSALFLLFILGIIVFFVGKSEGINECKPFAIEVYRGNTTLEITYRDSIPVDTIVVYKKK